jgi:hypothetical protein
LCPPVGSGSASCMLAVERLIGCLQVAADFLQRRENAKAVPLRELSGLLDALAILFLDSAPVELASGDQHDGDNSRGESDGPAE